MDLDEKGRPDLGQRFLNSYLQLTGDYEGLALMRFYQLYRALVRAKVAALRLRQQGSGQPRRTPEWAVMQRYLDLAQRWSASSRLFLVIMHGLSGSGKSTLARGLGDALGAFRLTSDVERKRLFGVPAGASSGSGIADGIYSREAGIQTYARLRSLAAEILQAGFPVVVDAAFLRREQREDFRRLAEGNGAGFLIVACHAPEVVLRQRIVSRQAAGGDPSEADLAVLAHQLQNHDPLGNGEDTVTLRVDTTAPPAVNDLAARVRERIAGPGGTTLHYWQTD